MISGEEHSRRENSKCKGPEVGMIWHVPERKERPVWLEPRKQEGEEV